MRIKRPIALFAGLAIAATLSACSKDSGTTIDILAGDDSCEVAETDLAAGDITFRIENVGTDVTEVYVYGKSGDDFTKIVNEKENIGPGTSSDLEVSLSAGDYQVACKPGMVGDGIRTDLSVAGEGGSSED